MRTTNPAGCGSLEVAPGGLVDGLDISATDALAVLLSRGRLIIPTLVSGWTPVVVNGGATGASVDYTYGASAVAANSSGLRYVTSGIICLQADTAGTNYINWDKKLYMMFNIRIGNPDAEGVGRFQLKQVNTIGALAAKGIGIRVDNLALMGESYGAALGVVDLATSLTENIPASILIVHDPATPKIEWYVGGVLKGTQTTAANIPTGMGSATGQLVVSAANGATGGFAYNCFIIIPSFWQVL